MTRRRSKSKASTSDAPHPVEEPPTAELTSQLGNLGLRGGDPKSPAESQPLAAAAAAAPSGAKVGKSASVGGEAGPSASPQSSAASLTAASPSDAPAPSPALAEAKACACCTVVIAGKVFWCSRCHLVTYCGKDCQASGWKEMYYDANGRHVCPSLY